MYFLREGISPRDAGDVKEIHHFEAKSINLRRIHALLQVLL
jgi:hypothetical protein